MPGRLLNMATNGADGAKHVVNGKQSPGGAVQPAGDDTAIPGLGGKQRSATDANALTNGDNHIPGLGAYPTPNGVSPSSPASRPLHESIHDLPEEVVHIATNTHSLGELIQRVTGQCFHNLETLVDEMAEMKITIPPAITNGASAYQQQPSLSNEDERNNSKKKKLMLDFASENRAKFIKLLVVTGWAGRDNQDVGKLIDLKNWLQGQDDAATHAANSFYQLVADTRSFKLANPDLETALAVLVGGDVPWIPHFGFREQEKLSAEEVLKVLHQMNTIINLRLVLHEELPPQLRDYRVADGRATFTFPQEFELDVYVASEDPEQQWFFLDVRFLFDPAPQMTGDRLRGLIDQRLNMALAENGLRGACELAHDFVLTHKINIFRKQALNLARGAWASALVVDLVRRTLTVQYWAESPQAKSWIEIGIVSGKDSSRRRRADNAISSQIKARWIRNGKEQKDVKVPIDLGNLSLERVVMAHIARHSSHILESVQNSVEEQASKVSAGEEKALRVKLVTSETEPSDCALQARIGDHPTTNLQIDGITGRLYFSPAGPATPKAQDALERSKDPLSDAPTYLTRYLTYEIQVRIDRLIETMGWEVSRHLKASKEDVIRRTKRDVHRYQLFQPRGFKGSNWCVAYTINLCGESWWAFEVDESTPGTAMSATSQLRLPSAANDDYHVPLTLPALKKLEQSAASVVALTTSNRALRTNGVSTSLKHIAVKSSSTDDDAPNKTLPILMVRFSQLLKNRNSRFAQDFLQLQYLSFDTDLGQVRLVAKGKMRDPAKVQDILQHTKDPNISFSLDGSFSMMVDTKIGQTATPKVVARLNTLGTLCNLAKTLRSHSFACKEISFSKVCFTYAEGQEVTLHFHPNGRIKLCTPPQDPVRRIAPLLEEIINDPDVGFERFTAALSFFLPVLRAFATLEARHATHYPYSPAVLPRQVDFYRLVYPNPHLGPSKPLAAFDMHFKRNKDALEWRVSDVLPPAQREERETIAPGVAEVLAAFMKRVGSGWTGMRTLLVADKVGVEEAVLELDKVVWDALEVVRIAGPARTGEEGAGGEEGTKIKREIITID